MWDEDRSRSIGATMCHSARVCTTCKTRKKACDKSLPTCGYCTKRRLTCTYEDIAYIDYHQSSSVRAIRCPRQKHHHGVSIKTRPGHESPQSPPSPALVHDLTTLDKFLQSQCDQMLYSPPGCPEETCHRFFLGVHRWLPVICPGRFYATLSEYRGLPLPADLSLLLLTMWLMTSSPEEKVSERHPRSDVFSRATRMLLTHVQVTICASIRLIQAGLLLSAYDYASGDSKSAYMSIGTCMRMACILGLDQKCEVDDGAEMHGAESHRSSSELEQCNIWWGIVTLERLILCEIPDRTMRAASKYPTKHSHLPLDLRMSRSSDTPRQFPIETDCDVPSTRCAGETTISSFGRQVQAIDLVSQVQQIISSTDELEAKVPQLMEIDSKIRAFLTVSMRECGLNHGHHCGVTGTVIRALFLLHEYILNCPKIGLPESLHYNLTQCSQLALGTAVEIMIDVAHDHLRQITSANIDSLPLSCGYTLEITARYKGLRLDQKCCKQRREDEKALSDLYRAFRTRWK